MIGCDWRAWEGKEEERREKLEGLELVEEGNESFAGEKHLLRGEPTWEKGSVEQGRPKL